MIPPETKTFDEFPWAPAALKERLAADAVGVLRERGVNVPDATPVATVHEVLRIVSLMWVDGTVVPLEEFFIDPADEGLLFGRGVWESTRTIDGVPWLWSWHLERLQRTAEILGITVPAERLPTAEQVTAFVRGLTTQDVIVRLNATAGRPGKTGLVWMTAALQPVPFPALKLQSHRSPVQKGQPYLTLKTFQYATRLRMAQQAVTAGFDTALLIDDAGNVLEAANANIFLRLRDGWATPAADGGLLPGTVRQLLLQQSPVPVKEQIIPVARLAEVQEAFLTNSNVGVVPVEKIDHHTLAVGADTKKLMQWLQPPGKGNELRFAERSFLPR